MSKIYVITSGYLYDEYYVVGCTTDKEVAIKYTKKLNTNGEEEDDYALITEYENLKKE